MPKALRTCWTLLNDTPSVSASSFVEGSATSCVRTSRIAAFTLASSNPPDKVLFAFAFFNFANSVHAYSLLRSFHRSAAFWPPLRPVVASVLRSWVVALPLLPRFVPVFFRLATWIHEPVQLKHAE